MPTPEHKHRFGVTLSDTLFTALAEDAARSEMNIGKFVSTLLGDVYEHRRVRVMTEEAQRAYDRPDASLAGIGVECLHRAVIADMNGDGSLQCSRCNEPVPEDKRPRFCECCGAYFERTVNEA